MKKCKTCGIEKELNDFHRNPKYKDGVLVHCKDCVRKKALSRYRKKAENKDWREKENKRARERYYNFYKNTHSKPTKEESLIAKIKWREKFPEKTKAQNKSQRIDSKGMNKHHWNYNKGFELDVFFLSTLQHRAVHRFMIYDQERMMYRKLNGELLDSKETCISFYNEIFEKENLL